MKHSKKRAFHFEKKSKKDGRKVLSYEELPLEQYEDTPEEKKKVNLDKKKILIACTIVVILVLPVIPAAVFKTAPSLPRMYQALP